MNDNINPCESPSTDTGKTGARSKPNGPSMKIGIICSSLMKLLYWAWESQAGGNIRVDLVFGYALLFGLYVYFLPRLGWASVALAFALMLAN
ncbi:MAG: hypothetical protein AAF664_25440 [Planctomycetota bacterium]